MKTRTILSALALLSLAACGKRDELRPAEGHVLPVKPAGAATQPTVDQLLTPSPETRPERSDDVLSKSKKRTEDRFDLPPPG